MTPITCCSSGMSLVCFLLSCVQVSSFTKQVICDALESGDVFSRIQLNKRLHRLALMSWSICISLHFELKILYRADPFLEKSIPLSNSRFLYLYNIHWDLPVVCKATWLSATHLLYDRWSASSTNPTRWNQICTRSMYPACLRTISLFTRCNILWAAEYSGISFWSSWLYHLKCQCVVASL